VVGVVAAVWLLAAGGLSLLPRMSDRDEIAADDADTGAGSLVAIWTEGSAEIAAEAPTSGMATNRATDAAVASPEVGNDDADPDNDSVLVADDDYNVPGWMIAAVAKGNSWAPGTDVEIREN